MPGDAPTQMFGAIALFLALAGGSLWCLADIAAAQVAPIPGQQASTAPGPSPNAAAIRLADLVGIDTVIGPLNLTVHSDAAAGQALVTATLSGAVIETQLLTVASPAFTLDIAVGAASAKGRLTLRLRPAPAYSAVMADLVATAGGTPMPFRGAIDHWMAIGEPLVGEYTAVLNGELTTRTVVRGTAGNIVQFQLFSGSLMVAGMTATQLSPQQVFPSEIVAGDLKIEAGAKISMTIPTAVQSGMVFLQAVASTSSTPPTQISAAVAQWALPSQP